MVVDYIGQVICGQVIGALIQHFVVKNRRVDGYFAAHQVVDHHILSRFNLDAHHILVAVVDAALNLVGRQSQRVGHVHARGRVILEVGRFGTGLFQLFRRVEGYVGTAVVEQLTGIFSVYVAAFALAVGSVRAACGHAFVEFDAEPVHGLDDVFFGSRHKAAAVCVFYAQNHFAAVMTGKKIVVEGCAYSANMKRTGG